jgi:hypothetical protein
MSMASGLGPRDISINAVLAELADRVLRKRLVHEEWLGTIWGVSLVSS